MLVSQRLLCSAIGRLVPITIGRLLGIRRGVPIMSEMTPLLIDIERLSARMRRVSPECAEMLYGLWQEYAGEEGE